MSKVLIMCDLHLTTGSETIIGLEPRARFLAGLRHASRNQPDADRMILMGDLANKGEPEAYAFLGDALAEAPWPVSFLLGNHDNRANFRKAFPTCPTDPSGFVQSVVDLEDVRLVMLDSLEPSLGEAGLLCEDRLHWLGDVLRDADRPCLVFIHHPPFPTGFAAMDEIGLQNAEAFLSLLNDSSVAHLFAGHVHRTITASIDGLPATVFKGTCHQTGMRLGKSGFGSPVDEPGAYGVALTTEKSVVVHFVDFTLPTSNL